jgi:hypothetical protein
MIGGVIVAQQWEETPLLKTFFRNNYLAAFVQEWPKTHQ